MGWRSLRGETVVAADPFPTTHGHSPIIHLYPINDSMHVHRLPVAGQRTPCWLSLSGAFGPAATVGNVRQRCVSNENRVLYHHFVCRETSIGQRTRDALGSSDDQTALTTRPYTVPLRRSSYFTDSQLPVIFRGIPFPTSSIILILILESRSTHWTNDQDALFRLPDPGSGLFGL